jgi:GNAT superfamily N-acetyltransferase
MIRQADLAKDREAIAMLWRAYAEYLVAIDCYDFGGETVEPELARLAELYTASAGGIWLATLEKGAVTGTVAINRIDSETAEIRRLFVLPEYRGHGLARQMMRKAEETACTLGYTRIFLDTFRSQPGPQKLYRSLGFFEREPYNDYPKEHVMFFEKRYGEKA